MRPYFPKLKTGVLIKREKNWTQRHTKQKYYVITEAQSGVYKDIQGMLKNHRKEGDKRKDTLIEPLERQSWQHYDLFFISTCLKYKNSWGYPRKRKWS